MHKKRIDNYKIWCLPVCPAMYFSKLKRLMCASLVLYHWAMSPVCFSLFVLMYKCEWIIWLARIVNFLDNWLQGRNFKKIKSICKTNVYSKNEKGSIYMVVELTHWGFGWGQIVFPLEILDQNSYKLKNYLHKMVFLNFVLFHWAVKE